MKPLFRFVARYPWIFVVLAFLLLIAGWTTAYILAGRVNTSEVPLSPPTHHSPATPTDKP